MKKQTTRSNFTNFVCFFFFNSVMTFWNAYLSKNIGIFINDTALLQAGDYASNIT